LLLSPFLDQDRLRDLPTLQTIFDNLLYWQWFFIRWRCYSGGWSGCGELHRASPQDHHFTCTRWDYFVIVSQGFENSLLFIDLSVGILFRFCDACFLQELFNL
jgi:hypothetical protein